MIHNPVSERGAVEVSRQMALIRLDWERGAPETPEEVRGAQLKLEQEVKALCEQNPELKAASDYADDSEVQKLWGHHWRSMIEKA